MRETEATTSTMSREMVTKVPGEELCRTAEERQTLRNNARQGRILCQTQVDTLPKERSAAEPVAHTWVHTQKIGEGGKKC